MENIEFCGEVRRESDHALMVYDGKTRVWIPKSQIKSQRCIKGDDFEFTIPEWLAREKGII